MYGLAFLLILVTPASAQSRPDWADRFEREDANYRYYVGRSSPSDSEALAIQRATWDAIEAAVRENYGFSLEVSSSSYESESSAIETKRSISRSDRVSLKEFESVDQYIEKTESPEKYTAWVKFRYLKSAIEKEKKRLASESTPDYGYSNLSHFGDETTLVDRGGVEIRVLPREANARISIDDDVYGKAPARIIGALSPGPHTLHLDAPAYEVVDQKFNILPGREEKIVVNLVPAFGTISVESEPENAEIRVNGARLKSGERSSFRVRAGQVFKVEVASDGYFSESIEGMVERGGTWARAVRLEPKGKLRAPAGTENAVSPSSREEAISNSQSYWSHRFLTFYLYGGVGGVPANTGVNEQITYFGGGGVRLRILYSFGFEIASGAGTIYEDPNATRSGPAAKGMFHELKYGFPIFLSGPGQSSSGASWTLTPEITRYRTNYSVSGTSLSTREGRDSYKAYGIRLGWESEKRPQYFGDWGAGFGIDVSYDQGENGGPGVGKVAFKLLFGP